MIDIGAHMLDSTLYLLDYPEISYVAATYSNRLGKTSKAGLMGSWDTEKFTVEDSLFGFIRFKNGTSLELQTSFAINQKERDMRSVKLFDPAREPVSFHWKSMARKKGRSMTNSIRLWR